jgi:hypothetical protein
LDREGQGVWKSGTTGLKLDGAELGNASMMMYSSPTFLRRTFLKERKESARGHDFILRSCSCCLGCAFGHTHTIFQATRQLLSWAGPSKEASNLRLNGPHHHRTFPSSVFSDKNSRNLRRVRVSRRVGEVRQSFLSKKEHDRPRGLVLLGWILLACAVEKSDLTGRTDYSK